VGKTEGTRGRGGGEVHEKLDMLTLCCLCRVIGLGQLGSCHVVGNDQFRGHSVCTLYTLPGVWATVPSYDRIYVDQTSDIEAMCDQLPRILIGHVHK